MNSHPQNANKPLNSSPVQQNNERIIPFVTGTILGSLVRPNYYQPYPYYSYPYYSYPYYGYPYYGYPYYGYPRRRRYFDHNRY